MWTKIAARLPEEVCQKIRTTLVDKSADESDLIRWGLIPSEKFNVSLAHSLPSGMEGGGASLRGHFLDNVVGFKNGDNAERNRRCRIIISEMILTVVGAKMVWKPPFMSSVTVPERGSYGLSC